MNSQQNLQVARPELLVFCDKLSLVLLLGQQESKLRCRDFKTFRDFNGFHVSWMLHNWLLACCWVWPRFRLERCKSSRMLASKHRWCQQVPASQSRRSLTVGYSHVISQATANIYHQNTNSLQNVQINIPLKPKWKPFSQLIGTEYLLYLLWCNKTYRMVPLDRWTAWLQPAAPVVVSGPGTNRRRDTWSAPSPISTCPLEASALGTSWNLDQQRSRANQAILHLPTLSIYNHNRKPIETITGKGSWSVRKANTEFMEWCRMYANRHGRRPFEKIARLALAPCRRGDPSIIPRHPMLGVTLQFQQTAPQWKKNKAFILSVNGIRVVPLNRWNELNNFKHLWQYIIRRQEITWDESVSHVVRPILACCLENLMKRYTKLENSSLGPLSGLEGCYNCSLLLCELNCDSFLSSTHMQNRAYKSKRISKDLKMSEQRKETFRLLTTINSRNIIIPAQWYDIYKYLYIL